MKRYFKHLFLIIYLLNNSLIAKTNNHDEYKCDENKILKTPNPPFMISDGNLQKYKAWENFRSKPDALKTSIKSYIPKGSLVFYDGKIDTKDTKNKYVNVTVLNVPKRVFNKNIAARYEPLFGNGNFEQAESGDVGYISQKSLLPVDDYLFMVKAPIELKPGKKTEPLKALRVVKEGEDFLAIKCCKEKDESVQVKDDCFYKYKFELINARTLETLSSVFESPLMSKNCSCDFSSLYPVPKDTVQSLAEILLSYNLKPGGSTDDKLMSLAPVQANREMGHPFMIRGEDVLVQLPNVQNYGDEPGDANKSDTYLKPLALCAFSKLVLSFHNTYNSKGDLLGYKIYYGDCFDLTKGEKEIKMRGEHESHINGECIDIRPLRLNDDDKKGLTYYDTKSTKRYSKDKTQLFIDLALKFGANPNQLFFNDKKIIGAKYQSGHSNHIHLCFPNTAEVRKACTGN